MSDFIQRGENGVFTCSHPEGVGSFVVRKPNFGLDIKVEQMAAVLSGATPTEQGDLYAEWFSVISCGMESTPKDFDLNKVVDVKGLVPALYAEVTEYWGTFRK